MGDTPIEELPLSKGSRSGARLASLRVDVTDEIIGIAVPKNSGHCMVSDSVHASALAKGWKISKVLTDLQTVRFTDLKKRVRYICFTPRIAQLALLAFDQGHRPTPFSFRLKAVQVIEKKARGPRKRSGAGKARVAVAIRKDGTNQRPIKHGGREIPTTVGQRREFGLRGLGVWHPPTEAETATAV